MPVRIELYGVVRRKAGLPAVTVAATTLSEALRSACHVVPALSECLTPDGRLRGSYIANLNGSRFVSDAHTPLQDGDAVLLLSADAGG